MFSEQKVFEAIADELTLIKSQDRLSWDDVAFVLGVSDTQAAKYADAASRTKMSVVTYARAKREWNGRFTGALDRLCVDSRPAANADPRHCESSILKAALALSVALADGELTVAEVKANRATLEQARDAIEAQLHRLGPKAA